METLGTEPVVVAQGRQMQNFVPVGAFLRRDPNLAAIQTAIAETVDTGTGLASITPNTHLVIRTEPVAMTDGRIHGVHVWCGPTDADPPERPVPGPLKWDITTGEGSATVEYLLNAGMDPSVEATTGRAFADDLPSHSLNPDESKELAWAIDAIPDRTYCATWDFHDKQGVSRKVGWCARTLMESAEDGHDHLVARAMNLVEAVGEAPIPAELLTDPLVTGEAQQGVYRVIVDLGSWTALTWIDDPCPYVDWRGRLQMDAEDLDRLAALSPAEPRPAEQEMSPPVAAVVRLPGADGTPVPIHVTINSTVEVGGGCVGLVSVRLPTADESIPAGITGGDAVSDTGSNGESAETSSRPG